MRLCIETAQGAREYVAPAGANYVMIGSRLTDDIHIADDPAISDPHARLEFLGKWTIADQFSATGTLLNGKKTYTADLARGDVIKIGGARLIVLELDNVATVQETAPAPPPAMALQPVTGRAPAAIAGVLALLALAAGGGLFFFLRASQEPAQLAVAARDPVVVPQPPVPLERPKPLPPEEPPVVTPPPPPPPGLTPARAKELEGKLKVLADGATEANCVVSLRELEAIEAECVLDKNLRWPLERSRTNVEQAIMVEMQRRYGRDNGDIYDLTEKSRHREAKERFDALEVHLNQTTTHAKLARRMEMDKYLRDKPPQLQKGNEEFLARILTSADENLMRRQFASAAEQLGLLGAQAVLSEEMAERLKAEKVHWEAMAAKQKEGDVDPPVAPFDPRKNRPPPAPKSGLLKNGEAGTAPAQRAIDKRLEQVLKSGAIVGTRTTHHGRVATVVKPDDWRMKLAITRPHAGAAGEFVFVVRYALHQLPPATRLALQEGLTPSRDELLALLLYAFANGLPDDAARVACALWKADDAVKADLDALLAAKLRIAVPEGGFIERSGRLVAKE